MANWSTRQSCGFSEDFEEEEVWNSFKGSEDSSSSSSWRLPSAPKMVPNRISSKTHETQMGNRSSAPMDIPDWSKIYGKTSSSVKNDSRSHYSGGEDDHDDDVVPPHEWIAQKLARSRKSSFSVCEGIGRTLKGRDLSKVRNAILTKTGFLE